MKLQSKFLPTRRTLDLMCAIFAAYIAEADGLTSELRVLLLALEADLGPEQMLVYEEDMRVLLVQHPVWRATRIMIERAVGRNEKKAALAAQGWAHYGKSPIQKAKESLNA